MNARILLAAFILCVGWSSCKSPSAGIFGKRTPHEIYSQRITDAGLAQTALGSMWKSAAAKSLAQPVPVVIPYSEEGYFAAERPTALGLTFNVRTGEKLRISLTAKSNPQTTMYLDLWERRNDGQQKILAVADTTTGGIEYDVNSSQTLIVRLQPELLVSGEYSISITTGPSLAFPVQGGTRSSVGSFWGSDRDAGARRHEGIDIFGKMETPLLAVAPGTISRVEETKLGGKVVWLRPEGKPYHIYYAHLNEQLVRPGQEVKQGDVVGLMGKTGNAKSTAPHLHFGIYTMGGAIDPFPFVNPSVKNPPAITNREAVARQVRTKQAKTPVYAAPTKDTTQRSSTLHTLLRVEAAMAGYYRVTLPDNTTGYVNSSQVTSLNAPLKQLELKNTRSLLNAPDSLAPRITQLPSGTKVAVLAVYNDYDYVRHETNEGWIRR